MEPSLPVLGYRCWRVIALDEQGNPTSANYHPHFPNNNPHRGVRPGDPHGFYSVATVVPWRLGGWTKADWCFNGIGSKHRDACPVPECSCGLYSFASWSVAHGWMTNVMVGGGFQTPMILGLTLNWGRVVPHGQQTTGMLGQQRQIEGFRARYSRPVAFVRPDWEEQSVVEWLAKESGAPMLHDLRQLGKVGNQLIDQSLARDPQTLGVPSTVPRVQEPF